MKSRTRGARENRQNKYLDAAAERLKKRKQEGKDGITPSLVLEETKDGLSLSEGLEEHPAIVAALRGAAAKETKRNKNSKPSIPKPTHTAASSSSATSSSGQIVKDTSRLFRHLFFTSSLDAKDSSAAISNGKDEARKGGKFYRAQTTTRMYEPSDYDGSPDGSQNGRKREFEEKIEKEDDFNPIAYGSIVRAEVGSSQADDDSNDNTMYTCNIMNVNNFIEGSIFDFCSPYGSEGAIMIHDDHTVKSGIDSDVSEKIVWHPEQRHNSLATPADRQEYTNAQLQRMIAKAPTQGRLRPPKGYQLPQPPSNSQVALSKCMNWSKKHVSNLVYVKTEKKVYNLTPIGKGKYNNEFQEDKDNESDYVSESSSYIDEYPDRDVIHGDATELISPWQLSTHCEKLDMWCENKMKKIDQEGAATCLVQMVEDIATDVVYGAYDCTGGRRAKELEAMEDVIWIPEKRLSRVASITDKMTYEDEEELERLFEPTTAKTSSEFLKNHIINMEPSSMLQYFMKSNAPLHEMDPNLYKYPDSETYRQTWTTTNAVYPWDPELRTARVADATDKIAYDFSEYNLEKLFEGSKDFDEALRRDKKEIGLLGRVSNKSRPMLSVDKQWIGPRYVQGRELYKGTAEELESRWRLDTCCRRLDRFIEDDCLSGPVLATVPGHLVLEEEEEEEEEAIRWNPEVRQLRAACEMDVRTTQIKKAFHGDGIYNQSADDAGGADREIDELESLLEAHLDGHTIDEFFMKEEDLTWRNSNGDDVYIDVASDVELVHWNPEYRETPLFSKTDRRVFLQHLTA